MAHSQNRFGLLLPPPLILSPQHCNHTPWSESLDKRLYERIYDEFAACDVVCSIAL